MGQTLEQETTTPEVMRAVIQRHMDAEAAGDVDAALAVYTDDVEHDVVGSPTGPVSGGDAVRPFYEDLVSNIETVEEHMTHEYFGANHCTIEHEYTAIVTGSLLGVPGHGKQITFRMLHVFEFRGDRICRENVWLDGGSIIGQLTA